jgi:uncharacterized protein YigE (DUF2233 family)
MQRHRSPWSEIAKGLEMRRFTSVNGGGAAHIVAFRFTPSRLHVVTGRPANASTWRARERGLVAVNGAFFDPHNKSLGLRISEGETRVRRVAEGGPIFIVRRGRASIVPASDFKLRRGTTQAIQCSPRLVANGKVAKLKDQWARRTALGIRRDGRVVLAVADGAITFRDWASIWAAPDGLACRDAMSLDGGGSTQLSVRTARAQLEISGFTDVPDAIIVR